MSIKSDKWIRRMSQEHGMIEPFEAGQVSEGVISYGLSSYGYDIRVAPEFKVFTNVYNVVVDPKRFDPRSFVDVNEDTCIIPPNSFALARTVEYFRIPRNVLAVCLGKSTYARCFSGDTRVALVDGTAPTLKDMARRAQDGEMFWGYSIEELGRVQVALLDAPRFVGRDALLEVELDDGSTVRCTADHEFVLRDGRYLAAAELRPGESLMPLYRTVVRGYESLYQPLTGYIEQTHRLADEWNTRNAIYGDVPGTHRHHRDRDRRNNNPWNLERIEAGEHIRMHNRTNYSEDFDPEEHGRAIRDALAARRQDSTWRKNFSRLQRDRALAFWRDDDYAAAREMLRARHAANWTAARREDLAARMRERYANPANRDLHGYRQRAAWSGAAPERRERQREVARMIRLRPEITREAALRALHETGSVRAAARVLECDRSVFRRFPGLVEEFLGTQRRLNHKIAAIRSLPGEHDVYCLTVPEGGNFALDAGVFVQNCGIVVNVTPLEPSWEGFLTLEISNTTPLPAKIYAGEGIAQLLFFEGDEEPEIAYADRKGKYQKQVGVTLPKL
ncbi:MAG: dCTP deaminase [Gemmatimonadetes bacterium]|nr:dCTP deaminase [Gemmatimonadota bacterium]